MAGQNTILVAGLLVFNLLAFLPLLSSSSVRRLFGKLPSDHLSINFFLGICGFTLSHFVVLLSVVSLSGGLEDAAALWGPGLATAATGAIFWAVAVFVLPNENVWDPKQGDELDGRIALSLGLVWYFLSTAVVLFLLMVALIALFFPEPA